MTKEQLVKIRGQADAAMAAELGQLEPDPAGEEAEKA